MALGGLDIFLIILYFLVVFAIGLWVRKRETTNEFIIGGRKIGVLQTAASLMAVVGGMLLVSQAALAYDMGFTAMWIWIGFALGFVFLGLAAKKLKTLADENKFITISDYFFTKFGKKNGYLGATIIFVAFFSLLVGQFIAGGSIFSPLLGIPYSLAVIILGLGTLVYLVLGGFKAVVKTDLLQFLIMFFVFILLLFSINIGDFSPEQLDFNSGGLLTSVIFLIMGSFVVFGSADIWQRVYASRDVKTARSASYWSALLFVIFGFALTLVGIAAKNSFPDISSSEALYYGFTQLLPAPLLGVASIVILAAIMSTIDTELFVLSSSIAKDFFYRKKKRSDEEIAKIIRKSIMVIAILSMLVAIFVSEILLVLFGLASLILIVSPSVMASLFWKMKKRAVLLSMIAGLISLIILIATGSFNPDTSIITLPTAIVFLVIGQVIFRK